MAIGAVLSNWVMELTVLPLVGLVGRLFCSMAGGFNSLAETLGAPTFIGKVFAFASAGWCGGAQPIHQVRSEAEPARPLGRSVSPRSEAKRSGCFASNLCTAWG
jgi:hypothetical protein